MTKTRPPSRRRVQRRQLPSSTPSNAVVRAVALGVQVVLWSGFALGLYLLFTA